MTRSATFVIAIWAFVLGGQVGGLWLAPGSYVILVVAILFLIISIALGVHESRKSGRSA